MKQGAALPNKPLKLMWSPQGHRVESRGRLGGAHTAERQGVRQSSCRSLGELSAGGEVAAFLSRGSSSRRGSLGCEVQVCDGNCTGADLPLAKIVAAWVGPSTPG
jgi:hypothetical protein